MKTHKSFTLIELLVVISIIILLLSILMPALSKAKEKAREIQCMNNLKQAGFSFTSYTGDNNSYFPYAYANGTPGWYFWPRDIYPYHNNKDLLVCPTRATVAIPYSGFGELYKTTYAMNNNLEWKKIEQFRNASQVWVLYAGWMQTVTWRQIESTTYIYLDIIHHGGANVLYIDNHVAWRKLGQWEGIENK